MTLLSYMDVALLFACAVLGFAWVTAEIDMARIKREYRSHPQWGK